MRSHHQLGRWAFLGIPLVLALLSVPMKSVLQAQDRPFPYSLGKEDLLLVPLGVGMAVWGDALMDGKGEISRSKIEGLRQSDVNWFDRGATGNWSLSWGERSDEYRDVVVGATHLFLGIEGTLLLLKGRFPEGVTMGVMFAELFANTLGAVSAAKALSGRKRPYVFNPSLSVDERFHLAASDGNDVFFSFFSGHSAAAFAAASFTSTLFTDLHGRSVWSNLVWGSTLTAASMAAYSRVKAGKHYPSDVLIGALVGSAIGHLIPRLHRKEADGRVRLGTSPSGLRVSVVF